MAVEQGQDLAPGQEWGTVNVALGNCADCGEPVEMDSFVYNGREFRHVHCPAPPLCTCIGDVLMDPACPTHKRTATSQSSPPEEREL